MDATTKNEEEVNVPYRLMAIIKNLNQVCQELIEITDELTDPAQEMEVD